MKTPLIAVFCLAYALTLNLVGSMGFDDSEWKVCIYIDPTKTGAAAVHGVSVMADEECPATTVIDE